MNNLIRKAIVPLFTVVCTVTLLSACGGGGGGGSAVTPTNPTTPTNPNPPPTDQCSIAGQNQQLLDFMQEQYLWYQDMPTGLSGGDFNSMQETLNAAKVAQDRFSFIMSVEDYQATFEDANTVAYGFSNRVAADGQSLEIRYVFDNGGAFDAGLRRGDKIIEINGVAVGELANQVNSGSTTWGNIFGPREVGVSMDIRYEKPNGDIITESMLRSVIDTNTVMANQVLTTTSDKKVGYLVFDSFIERSRQDLDTAFTQFQQSGVDELVLDLRYNGGGFVSVANQLASQIGGNNVANQVFTALVYNDKQTSRNSSSLFALGDGTSQLNLDRVVVLTTSETCSASEMVINSLAPFIDVVTVGSTTCGKPVGMNPQQICDSMVFAINFQAVNAVGNGDYFNGFAPHCFAEDAIVADWGSLDDPLLREAMFFINNDQCFTGNRSAVPRENLEHLLQPTPIPGDRSKIF